MRSSAPKRNAQLKNTSGGSSGDAAAAIREAAASVSGASVKASHESRVSSGSLPKNLPGKSSSQAGTTEVRG